MGSFKIEKDKLWLGRRIEIKWIVDKKQENES